MFCLGKYDKLETPIVTYLIEDVQTEDGIPTAMPRVGSDNYVVCAVQYADMTIELTVCKTLKQMRNQYVWAVIDTEKRGGHGRIHWYLADREQCDNAHEKLAAAGT